MTEIQSGLAGRFDDTVTPDLPETAEEGRYTADVNGWEYDDEKSNDGYRQYWRFGDYNLTAHDGTGAVHLSPPNVVSPHQLVTLQRNCEDVFEFAVQWMLANDPEHLNIKRENPGFNEQYGEWLHHQAVLQGEAEPREPETVSSTFDDFTEEE